MAAIAKDKVVSIHYTLTDDDGAVLDASSHGPLAYLHGHGTIIPGLERELEGLSVGDEKNVTVAPADAYGLSDPDAVQKVHRSEFPKDMELEVGRAVHASTPDGQHLTLWITEIKGAYITLTTNHPLADKTLHFAVKVAEVRDATPEELDHGHVHGPGGHHH